MKKDLCEIICVVDRSGSMFSIRSDSIGAFNRFLEEQQKQPGEARLTLMLFNETNVLVHSGQDIKHVAPLTEVTYLPMGGTALLDAVGKAVDTVGKRLHETPESDRPEKVIVAILTDGEENSSQEYTREQVFEKIKHQREKYSWEFVFLAAGQEAFAEAQALGIKGSQTLMYAQNNPQAHHQASQALCSTVSSYRSGGSADLNP